MKKLYFSILVILISTASFAQLQLKPAIGPASLPNDNDPICNIICSSNYNFDNEGLKVGDTIPQFQFYTLNGTPIDALTQLQTGKPLLLIAGSITCPVYRGKISAINSLISTYGNKINTLIVYVTEAHPNTPDVSPYSCNVWTHSQNISEGVLYLQAKTYGQRKAAATDMMNNVCSCMPVINAPVVMDGPCNEYWKTFGEAPNNAYLINPVNGTVYCKHGWFNKAPSNMADCIDSLLAIVTVNEQSIAGNKNVFPNPLTDRAVISLADNFQLSGIDINSLKLSVFDIFGKMTNIPSERIHNGFEIKKGCLANGVYFYKIQSATEILSSGKIIIQ